MCGRVAGALRIACDGGPSSTKRRRVDFDTKLEALLFDFNHAAAAGIQRRVALFPSLSGHTVVLCALSIRRALSPPRPY